MWYQFFFRSMFQRSIASKPWNGAMTVEEFGEGKFSKTKSERLDLYLLAHGTGMSMLLSSMDHNPYINWL